MVLSLQKAMKSMKEKQSAFFYEPEMFVSKLNLYDETRTAFPCSCLNGIFQDRIQSSYHCNIATPDILINWILGGSLGVASGSN